MSRTQEAIGLILNGYTAPEITEMLGYKGNATVYEIARRNGLKIEKANARRVSKIVRLREEGKSASEIAKAVGLTTTGVMATVNRYGLKDVELNPEMTARVCKVCGAEFTVPAYSNKSYCCEAHARKAGRRRINHGMTQKRHVVRQKEAKTEDSKDISVDSLYRRDGGVCWLCGELCDISASPNANIYPSVDHVVPIANGGLDEWGNVRLAHRWCNSKRGNRQEVIRTYPPFAKKRGAPYGDRVVESSLR